MKQGITRKMNVICKTNDGETYNLTFKDSPSLERLQDSYEEAYEKGDLIELKIEWIFSR